MPDDIDTILGDGWSDLAGRRVSASERDNAVIEGGLAVEEARRKIKSGTSAAKVLQLLTEAFVSGTKKGLLS